MTVQRYMFEHSSQRRQANADAAIEFDALVAQYQARVFATAYRIMRNYQDAEDQTQEVFLKVYRRLDTLSDPAALGAWITRIAIHTCYDALDRRRRYPQTIPLTVITGNESAEDCHPDTQMPSPEEEALRSEQRTQLAAVLAGLDDTAREVLVLHDIQGRSYEEITQALSIGKSAAKMRIHRARRAFQQAYGRVEYGALCYSAMR